MSPAAPALSVVIPMRNEEAHVAAQLEALAAQPTRDWELIVVDNGSDDDSVAIVEGWADRLPAVQVVSAPAATSIAAVRNIGAALARSDRLAFVDADDVVDAGWLPAVVDGLAEADLATGPIGLARLNEPGSMAWSVDVRDGLPVAYDFLPFVSGSNFGIRREVFERLGGFDAGVHHAEDVDLSWRAQLAGHRIATRDEALVHRRLRASTRGLLRQHVGFGVSSAELYVRFRSHGMRRDTLPALVREVAFLVVRAYRLGDPAFRRLWIAVAGRRAGRLIGAVRCRVVYL